VGAAVGAVLGVIAAFIDGHPSEWWAAAGIVGTVGAITGAITGTRRRVIAIASVGLILGFTGWVVAVRDTEGFIQAIAFGAPIGALLGAIVGRIGERKRWLT